MSIDKAIARILELVPPDPLAVACQDCKQAKHSPCASVDVDHAPTVVMLDRTGVHPSRRLAAHAAAKEALAQFAITICDTASLKIMRRTVPRRGRA